MNMEINPILAQIKVGQVTGHTTVFFLAHLCLCTVGTYASLSVCPVSLEGLMSLESEINESCHWQVCSLQCQVAFFVTPVIFACKLRHIKLWHIIHCIFRVNLAVALTFMNLRRILGKSFWSSCVRFTYADLLTKPTLLIHTSLVAESWIFQFTHDFP